MNAESILQKEISINSPENLFRILVIDDDLDLLESIRDRLEISGFQVDIAKSLEQAKILLNERQYTLLITDERFANSKESGSEFLIENLNLLNQAKPILFTGYGNSIPNRKELYEYGIEVINKGDPAFYDKIKNYYNELVSEFTQKIQQNVSSNLPIKNSDEPEPTSETQPVNNEGISPHIASDLWTTDDALGYGDYAYAIYKFLTHPKTKPPLTISIQAPWGGGKTSLMRMIRKFIDPNADIQLETATQNPSGELKLKEAITEIKKWIEEKTNRKPIENDGNGSLEIGNSETSNLTIWFNAWKYENTNQVWAGLIDAIMQQVADRLSIKERELFWLRLNLKRVDADKIRKKIHDRIFNYFWRGFYIWAIGLITIALPLILITLGYHLKLFGYLFDNFTSGISLSLIGTLLFTFGKYFYARYKANNEPAVISLIDYLEIPNYSAEFGFVHRAEIDLKNVIESIPAQYKPLVIFIDDLDRCSPTKISQVVEAVNLFLAGDFPHCMFVIGMDTEMVAAALQSAHKDMIDNLPEDLGIPIGWRFMDKFVQLPFLIPPSQRYTNSYIDSLFAFEESVDILIEQAKEREDLLREKSKQFKLTSEELEKLDNFELSKGNLQQYKKNLDAFSKQVYIDRGIEIFTDNNEEIRKLMINEKAFDYFSGNPRELKRFVNAFRFNYFLWWAQRSQNSEDVVSIEQLLRWTVLSMKWAEVIRWLRRGSGSEWEPIQSHKTAKTLKFELVQRLKLLEKISINSENFGVWKETLNKKFQLEPKITNWLNDEDLFQFFRKEGNIKEGKRLSDGIGKGLW